VIIWHCASGATIRVQIKLKPFADFGAFLRRIPDRRDNDNEMPHVHAPRLPNIVLLK